MKSSTLFESPEATDTMRYFAKLSSVGAFTWVKINLLGGMSTVLSFIVGLTLLITSVDMGDTSPAGFSEAVMTYLSLRPIGCALLIALLITFIFYFVFGNKYVVMKLVHRLAKDKSEALIGPFIKKILEAFVQHQPEALRKGADYSLLKLKLIDQVRNDSGNKWLKRIVTFGMRKMQLDDVDFSNEQLSFPDIIEAKLHAILHNLTEPNKKSIWMLVALQWLFLALIGLLPY